MPKIKTTEHVDDCINIVEYIPEYPYTYIQSIEQSIKRTPSRANIYRHESELTLLEALKDGRARAL